MYNTVLLNNFLDFLEGLNGFQPTVGCGGGTVGCFTNIGCWKFKIFFSHFWVLLDLTRWEIGIKSGPERSNMPRIGFEVRYFRPYFYRFI